MTDASWSSATHWRPRSAHDLPLIISAIGGGPVNP